MQLYNPVLNINFKDFVSVKRRIERSYQKFKGLKEENPQNKEIQILAQQIYRIQSHRKYDKDIHSSIIEDVQQYLPIISSEGKLPTDLEKLLSTFFKKVKTPKKVKKSKKVKTPKVSKLKDLNAAPIAKKAIEKNKFLEIYIF